MEASGKPFCIGTGRNNKPWNQSFDEKTFCLNRGRERKPFLKLWLGSLVKEIDFS